MRFITEHERTSPLSDLHEEALGSTSCYSVWAAVAYVGRDEPFLKKCRDSKKPTKLWARYDSSPACHPDPLATFLTYESPNYECRLVPDIFHAKVIWWKGFGIYIGSANLTDRAWYKNIEAGVFLDESEFVEGGLRPQIEDFFESLNERSHSLTREIVDEIKQLVKGDHQKARYNHEEEFKVTRKLLPELKPLIEITKTTSQNSRKSRFLKEWNETIQQLRGIANRLVEGSYRPVWVPEDTPGGIQADQFLHAYYYQQVRDGNRFPYQESYEQNRDDPEKALVEAMQWWAGLAKSPDSEERMITEWYPFLRKHLIPNGLPGLSKEEFYGVLSRIHAFRTHAYQVSWQKLGLDEPLPTMKVEERIKIVSDKMYNEYSDGGHSTQEVIDHVLFGGNEEDTPDRIFQVTDDKSWKIPHIGINMLGELVGWAKPDYSPPRNGRSNKALTALGMKVRIY